MPFENIYTNEMNSFHVVGIDRRLACSLTYLSDDGNCEVSGFINDIQLLFIPGTVFQVRDDDTVFIQCKILKVGNKTVQDTSGILPDDVAVITGSVELICQIEKCMYFEEKTNVGI